MPPRAARRPVPKAPPQTPSYITSTIQAFLTEHPNSLVLEDGRTLFDLREAQFALLAEHDRATFHLWSTESNLVRRVLAVTPRSSSLRLTTQRLGQPRSQTLDLAPDKHLRAPTSRDTTRQRYLRLLTRVFLAEFPDDRSEGLRSAMDLERSFGPGYARGSLTRGQHAWAVIAVNGAESQTTVDGILTIGLLWLQHCRDHAAPTSTRKGRLYQGLRLILPRGSAATTLSRLPWLNSRIARYELFELDETTEELTRRDPADHGNLTTRLIQTPNEAAALDRFAETIPKVLALLPPNTPTFGLNSNRLASPHSAPPAQTSGEPGQSRSHRDAGAACTVPSTATHAPAHRNTAPTPPTQACELRLRSNTELAFLLHGIEFARIRSAFAGQSFNRQLEITVGSGPAETILLPSTETHLRELIRHLFDRRRADTSSSTMPSTQDPLFRTEPESWLKSTLRAHLPELDPNLAPSPIYTEVPALTGAGGNLDRGMLDLLALTRDNRLAVLEIKAAEDLHLALQGLDYWIRVRHHHLANPDPTSGSFTNLSDLQQHGYFPETRLSPEPPQLILVAPALHIHPATEIILRHLDARVPWTLIALDERWRTHIKPIWRKRSSGA